MTPTVALRLGVAIALLAAAVPPQATAADPAADPAGVEFFEKKVRPILVARCLSCHGEAKMKGGLRLDSRDLIVKGGETGPAAVSGKPAESLIVDAINYGETVQMPPKSRLPAEEVATLTRWVEIGLPWPVEAAKAAAAKPGFNLQERKVGHWSWRAIANPPVLEIKNVAWPLGSIDRFLLAKLEASGLTPAAEADKRVLIRRLSFDLTGLPPQPDEVAAFEADRSQEAYGRLVDRLLASPRFGERWGRHWLDLVRYAETRGHEFDPAIPNAWQYRDYVTRAWNADVPYDQFVIEHLAGDLVSNPRIDPGTGANESILGTGFWFLGEEVHSPVDIRQDECDRLDNRLDVMSKTFLGLTVACARCHDHKFDAISQRDYYALSGFLISSTYRQVPFRSLAREKQAALQLQALQDEAQMRLLPRFARAMRSSIDRLAEDLTSAGSKVWREELERAKKDEAHPFHVFASVALDPACVDPKSLAMRLDELAPRSTAPAREMKVIVDFGALPSLETFQDGFGFGLRPTRPGDLQLEPRAGQVRLGLGDRASAAFDPVWERAKPKSERQVDHGTIGAWDRSGRTLRTPEFTIESGRLWYLVRGAGRAYVPVNSHLVIAGPLHGALLTEWADDSTGWRWVKQDLAAYKAHRTHVEFSPSDSGSLAIAKVIDSYDEPPMPDRSATLHARAVSAGPIFSIQELARRYQAVLATIRQTMESQGFDASDESRGQSALGNWLLGRLDLFGPDAASERIAFENEITKLQASRQTIARRVANDRLATAPAMFDGNGVNEHLLIRGSSKTPGPLVPRRFLEAIAGDRPIESEGSGRLGLARQVVARSDPFASRVIVNRVWHHLFGNGIVQSVDNFGVLGDPPSHPELLDHLAGSFMEDGWSLKRLIRSIVTTRAYRMSSRPDAQEARDPQNRLLHRMAVRRLEGEPIRDAILRVSGDLDDRMYGPSVAIHLTPYMQGRGRPASSGPLDGQGRRSLYIEVRRNFLSPMMLAFDAPTPFTTIGLRNVSNVPAQALILLNDPFVIDQSGRWADRVMKSRAEPAERIEWMYQTAFARNPDAAEVADAIAFLESQGNELGLGERAWRQDRRVWADLAHVLINSKEFVFLD